MEILHDFHYFSVVSRMAIPATARAALKFGGKQIELDFRGLFLIMVCDYE
jgi:hypothetical protein